MASPKPRQIALALAITVAVAIAIAREYPTPGHLLARYDAPTLNARAKAELLADLPRYVVRDAAAAAQARHTRVGQALSRKIHAFFTGTDPAILITDM